MRDDMREKLSTEITRKQFLQYIGTAMLMVLGFGNLISLLSGRKAERIYLQNPGGPKSTHGFGNSKFGA